MNALYIGEIIRQRRIELGMTQEQLGEGIYEPTTLSRIERGHQMPSLSKLNTLLQRLGLPGERYYALVSENELEIERIKADIKSLSMRKKYAEGLERIERLSTIIDDDDQISKQFILRSRVLLGKQVDTRYIPYDFDDQLSMLFEAIRMTIPDFDIEKIGQHWYSIDEMKIINQIGMTYGDNGYTRKAIDIYYQFMKYIKRKLTLYAETAPIAILVAYNYSLYLNEENRHIEAIEIAQWGWDISIQWARSGCMGGLLYVLGDAAYKIGKIDESRHYFLQSYYAYTLMKNTRNENIVRSKILENFNLSV